MAQDQRNPNQPTRREQDVFCPVHEDQVEKTAETKGMIKVLVGVTGAFALSMLCIAGTMLYVLLGMDKTFSNYMAAHKVETSAGFTQITLNRADIDLNHEDISTLYSGHRDQQKDIDDTKKRVQKIENKIFP